MKVAFCVPTFQRPELLRRCLDAIAAQDVTGVEDLEVVVVVIDNDADRSAEATVAAARTNCPFPIDYLVEPTPGEPWARNAAIAHCRDADAIAWQDDDEFSRPGWLRGMVATMRATGATLVQGPVVSEFEREPPAWIRTGRFFERTPEDGFTDMQEIPHNWARGAGCLVATDAYRRIGGFNTRFGRKGGCDLGWFIRARTAGERFFWAESAVIDEFIADSRCNLRWLVTRRYREGTTRSLLLAYELNAPWHRRLARGLRGVIMAARGLLLILWTLPRGTAERVRALRRTAFGVGVVVGTIGFGHEEYRRVHGS